MVKKSDFTFPSRDGIHTIHATKWQSEDIPPIAVLQIVHGMAEHIKRYDGFASYLAEKGFVVIGDDHLGHGRTAKQYGDYGYICEKNPEVVLVRDEHRLKKLIQKEYADLPYFILGHSMGSLIARYYISLYGSGIDGAIIIGSPKYNFWMPIMGKAVINCFKIAGQSKKKSMLLDKVLFATNNKRTDKRTAFDWLNTDEKEVDLYMNDPWCGFIFTVNGFDALIRLAYKNNKSTLLKRIPKDLPVYILGGSEDPICAYGSNVEELSKEYHQYEIQDVTAKIYENNRHELLLECDKETVYDEIYKWLMTHISK